MTPEQYTAIEDRCQHRQESDGSPTGLKISQGQDTSMRQQKRADQQRKEPAQAHKAKLDEDLRELVMDDLVTSNPPFAVPLQLGIAEPRMTAWVSHHIAKAVKTIAKSCDPEALGA